MSGRLLALDPSKQVGWCLMLRDETPDFGTVDLEKYPTLHERLGRFGDWLIGFHRTRPFSAMSWEAPLLMPHDKMEQLLLLYGLQALCRHFVWTHHMPWQTVTPSIVKATLTGMARAPKGEKIDKDAMIAAAYKLGWEVLDHHQADAGGVGLATYSLIFPKVEA